MWALLKRGSLESLVQMVERCWHNCIKPCSVKLTSAACWPLLVVPTIKL